MTEKLSSVQEAPVSSQRAAYKTAPRNFITQTFAVAGKDLRAEWRTKETLQASMAFAIVILLLFSYAFDPSVEEVREISGGLLWLVFAFAGALILNRSFARELGNDCLEALISSPLSGAQLYLGKALASFVMLLAVECLCLPVFGVFYNVRWLRELPWLAAVLALGTWGLTAIGTMFSAMTVNLRLRELMLPVLLYPFLIPALAAAIQLTTVLMAGQPLGPDNLVLIRLLIVFDAIYTLLALALAEVVLIG